jgi:hypothetical protein
MAAIRNKVTGSQVTALATETPGHEVTPRGLAFFSLQLGLRGEAAGVDLDMVYNF